MKQQPKLKLKEADVKRMVTDWLNAHGIMWHFVPNQGTWNAKRGAYMSFKGTPGAPDIVAIVNGRYVGIELKSSIGRLSAAQRDFGHKLAKAGCNYLVINGSPESMRALEEIVKFGGDPPRVEILMREL